MRSLLLLLLLCGVVVTTQGANCQVGSGTYGTLAAANCTTCPVCANGSFCSDGQNGNGRCICTSECATAGHLCDPADGWCKACVQTPAYVYPRPSNACPLVYAWYLPLGYTRCNSTCQQTRDIFLNPLSCTASGQPVNQLYCETYVGPVPPITRFCATDDCPLVNMTSSSTGSSNTTLPDASETIGDRINDALRDAFGSPLAGYIIIGTSVLAVGGIAYSVLNYAMRCVKTIGYIGVKS